MSKLTTIGTDTVLSHIDATLTEIGYTVELEVEDECERAEQRTQDRMALARLARQP